MSPWLSGQLLRSQTDERLAALAGEGHERAFAVLVERYRRPLLAFVRGLGAGGRAEDIVQQALLQAWVALHEGTEVEHVRGWLHQIARRATWRAAAAPASLQLTSALAATTDTERDVERRLEARWLLGELERLPQRQRDALVQTALQGRSSPEVAGQLGLTENALRQLLFRARTTLRAAASAIVPLPVVAWAAARGASGAPMTERVAELVGGGGSAGVAAGLTKAVVIVTATGTVAGGGLAVDHHFATARHPDHASIVQRAAPHPTPSAAAHARVVAVKAVDPPRSRPPRRHARVQAATPARQTPPTGERSGRLGHVTPTSASRDGSHDAATGEHDGSASTSGDGTDTATATATPDDAAAGTQTASAPSSLSSGETADATSPDDSGPSTDTIPTATDVRLPAEPGD
ncbi:MAG: hypothetical protein QOJ35_179 [Solirubrobacteraceae bacterium]|jgi:RNA polymerase sigma factor (sigma-70 family)|nr:hypothetical protein [Solirubrobacteraceae bacterium]